MCTVPAFFHPQVVVISGPCCLSEGLKRNDDADETRPGGAASGKQAMVLIINELFRPGRCFRTALLRYQRVRRAISNGTFPILDGGVAGVHDLGIGHPPARPANHSPRQRNRIREVRRVTRTNGGALPLAGRRGSAGRRDRSTAQPTEFGKLVYSCPTRLTDFLEVMRTDVPAGIGGSENVTGPVDLAGR